MGLFPAYEPFSSMSLQGARNSQPLYGVGDAGQHSSGPRGRELSSFFHQKALHEKETAQQEISKLKRKGIWQIFSFSDTSHDELKEKQAAVTRLEEKIDQINALYTPST